MIIFIGTGCCGFLRMYDLLISSGINVLYKFGNIKYQNSRESSCLLRGLIWKEKQETNLTTIKFISNYTHQCLIGHFYLPYVSLLLKDPNNKIICLKSNREKTIKSLMTHWGYCNPLCNYRKCTFRIAYEQYPDYSHLDFLKATEKYWDTYYDTCDLFIKNDRFIIVDSESLFVDEQVQKILFKFIELQIKPKILPFSIERYTISQSGGLGNVMFQMAEAIAFTNEFMLPKPKFGLPIVINRPAAYKSDTFMGGHAVEMISFIKHFKNIDWIGNFDASYDDKFMINDMYTFNKIHHMRNEILNAFDISDVIKHKLHEKYPLIWFNNVVSVHYRTMALPADTAISYRNIPISVIRRDTQWYIKAMDLFPPDWSFMIFSDNFNEAKKVFSSLKYKMIYAENIDTFTIPYIMSICAGHIVDCSTFSFWGAYLDKKQPNVKTICNPYIKKVFGNHFIPYSEWIMLD